MATQHKSLCELLASFNSNHVEYIVVGGHAVAFHGHPRFTDDIDSYVRATEDNGSRIVQALHDFGFASLALTAADFTAEDRMLQLGRFSRSIQSAST